MTWEDPPSPEAEVAYAIVTRIAAPVKQTQGNCKMDETSDEFLL